ncbi:MAG TPA: amidohydrolase family protein [Acidimicrobiales bacterium]|jgi:hypothetical protein|nr:amidohydrolase family protein [Acidimicrobiales bacterium]
MSDPLVVDVHVHLFAGPDDPIRDGYEIWEYGEGPEVEFGQRPGTFDDLVVAMAEQQCDHSVVLGMFVPDTEMATRRDELDARGEPADDADLRAALPERLQAYNDWILSEAARSPHLTPLIAADPSTLGGPAGADHLARAAGRGAKGVKVHPVVQGFFPDDPRMGPTYDLCQELGLTVLSHAGQTKGQPQYADPWAFASVMEAHPRLHLLLAHLGGAAWPQVRAFAAAFPTVSFDLCEIIAWTGSPGAPTADELGRLIRDIGADRVLFGTDFPWYEVDRTIDQLMTLPHLSDEERRGILGENAVRRIGLVTGAPAG